MRSTITFISGLLLTLAFASCTIADTTVTVEKTHLCCGSCVKAANKAVESVPGDKAEIDKDADKITITADNDADAQKAVDALVAAGFYGTVSNGSIKNDSGAPTGNVKTLSLTTHNCCKKCTVAINKIIKSVPGAEGEAKAKEDTFTVTGDFDATTLVKAFNDAGFAVTVAK
jgi:mercuric ion binding protein